MALVVAAVLVGLLGAVASQFLWQGDLTPVPDAVMETAPETADSIVEKAPVAAEEQAGTESEPDLPLPTTAQALLEEVGQVVDRLVAAFPKNLDSLEMKARYQKWTGKTDDAVKTWEECLELDPHYAHAYLGMAEVAAKMGDHAKAVELAGKALESAPQLFHAREVRCEGLLNLGRPEEAIEALEDYLPTDPRSHGYFLLGRSYMLLKEYEKAKENYQASIRTYPEYAEAHYGLSRACLRLGQKDAAREPMATYRKLMAERNPGRQGEDLTPVSFETLCDDAALVYTDAGRIYLAHGQPAEAERLCRRAAGLSPENLDCRQALAWLARSEGRTADAIRWLEESSNLDPKNPVYWLEIGNLHLALTQVQEAEKAFQKVRSIAPQDARGHAALASLYLRIGQKSSEALALARRAVELAPSASNYLLLATACERNGDEAAAADAKAQAEKQQEGVARP